MTPRKLAVEALLQLRDKGPVDQSCGICSNVDEIMDGIADEENVHFEVSINASTEIKLAMQKWPKYSGDPSYPIKPEDTDPEMAYDDAKKYGGMWDKHSEYGDLRWELLDWLIETLSKEEA